MNPNNHVRIIQVLCAILISIIAYMWIDIDRTLDDYGERLRRVELNQQRILTLLGEPPASSASHTAGAQAGEKTLIHTQIYP